MSIVVTLTSAELLTASEVGRMRRIASIQKNSAPAHGISSAGWSEDIEGACGELAFAKALNTYWAAPINNYKDADVGGYQVRTTGHPRGRLIVRQDDGDDEIFGFVTGMAPRFEIHGWIRAGDAKQDRYLDNPNGREAAWFVPRDALREFDAFRLNGGVKA